MKTRRVMRAPTSHERVDNMVGRVNDLADELVQKVLHGEPLQGFTDSQVFALKEAGHALLTARSCLQHALDGGT